MKKHALGQIDGSTSRLSSSHLALSKGPCYSITYCQRKLPLSPIYLVNVNVFISHVEKSLWHLAQMKVRGEERSEFWKEMRLQPAVAPKALVT